MATRAAVRPYVTRGHPLDVYSDCREMLEDYDGEGLVDYWEDWACQFGEGRGFYLNPKDKAFPSLCRALGEAACTVWQALDERIDGVAVETPAKPRETEKTQQVMGNVDAPSGPSLSLLELYEDVRRSLIATPRRSLNGGPIFSPLVGFLGTTMLQGDASEPGRLAESPPRDEEPTGANA